MFKQNLLIVVSAVLTATGSFISGKFSNALSKQAIYYTVGSSSSCRQIASAVGSFTTGSFPGNIIFVTSNGSAVNLYTSKLGSFCYNLITDHVALTP